MEVPPDRQSHFDGPDQGHPDTTEYVGSIENTDITAPDDDIGQDHASSHPRLSITELPSKPEEGQGKDTQGSECLAPELRQYISEDRLHENYMRDPLVADERMWPEGLQGGRWQEFLPAVKEALLQVPLAHLTSRESIEQICREGIEPNVDRPADARSHTYGLDRSLGLDRYAFTSWGDFETLFIPPGSRRLLLPASLILSERVVATQKDIASLFSSLVPSSEALSVRYEDRTPSEQHAIDQIYFSGMVTGEDFLDLTARRMLRYLYGKGGEPFPVFSEIGEIKHLGRIPAEAIAGELPLENTQAYTDSLLTLGFASPNIAYEVKNGTYQSAALNEGREKWRRILGL